MEGLSEGEDEKLTRTESFERSSNCNSYWLPWNFNCKRTEPLEFEDLGFLQVIFFTWLFPVASKGVRKTLEPLDLGKLPSRMEAKANSKRLEHLFNDEKGRAKNEKDISLWKVYWRFSWKKIIVLLLVSMSSFICDFISLGIVLRRLLDFLSDQDAPTKDGIILVCLLGVFAVFRALTRCLSMFLGARIGCYCKSAFLGLIYKKALKMKNPGEKTVGELVNLCSNDTTRVFEVSLMLEQLLVVPVAIISVGLYLFFYFGYTSLAGVGIILLLIPVQTGLGKLFAALRTKSVKWSDKRVKVISEAISSIKLIKMYAWEKPFAAVVQRLRKKEQFAIQKMAFVQAFTFTSGYVISNLAPVVTILTEVYSGRPLTLTKAFICISMFAMLHFYIIVGPLAVRCCAEAVVSFRRIKKFLLLEEHTNFRVGDLDSNHVLKLSNGCFSWKSSEVATSVENEKPNENGKSERDGEEGIEEEETNVDQEELTVRVVPEHETQSLLAIPTRVDDDTIFKKYVPLLFDLSIEVKKNSLIGICGTIGSGKSSFLNALLNEMEMTRGDISITNSIAYVPQQPWIINGTIRDNVLLGKAYEETFFKEVCYVCALDKDLEDMPSGDMTEIGERGVNLSGGQKQRLSLARALYAEKELYLLDDPLSAVDAEVGKHIFNCCIKMAMKNHSVIFVTHQLQFLKDCDYVIYMKDGRFQEEGTYEQLIEANQTFAMDIKKFHEEHDKTRKEEHITPVTIPGYLQNQLSTSSLLVSGSEIDIQSPVLEMDAVNTTNTRDDELKEQGRLVCEEEKETGSVSLRTYYDFLKHAGGVFLGFLIVCVILSSVILQMMSDYWLSVWLEKNSPNTQTNTTTNQTTRVDNSFVDRERTDYYMLRYGVYIAGMFLAAILSAILCVTYILRGATRLHNATFKVIFAAPMAFFDTTPIGRIVNRLAKDVDEIDHFLPFLTENTFRNFLRTASYAIFIGVVVPWMLIAVVILLVLFVIAAKYFRKIYRSIKRIENVTRSPILSSVTASAQGLVTLRAFKKQEMCTENFFSLVDKNILPLFLFYSFPRMFGVYIDLICMGMVVTTATVGVTLKGVIPASIAALCLVFSLKMFGLAQFTIRLCADLEARCLSLERLNHYIKTLKSEGEFNSIEKETIKDWPKDGTLSFTNVALRYREELPLVLKDFTIEIKDKEKIGIVGRTGAGKSSIGVVLYRLVNPQHGTIKIAGVDTQQIGLTDLRSALTIIPQDPVLFNGTIRYNLDPFDQYGDEEIWHAIEKAHLTDIIGSLPNKLQSTVDEGGSNFSVGERQLMCMARALLRKAKIMMMDEATASVDSRTDSKIQETIQTCFANCTVLTVAHRLNTIMHCDKILVMDNGQIAEFDSPGNLLSKQESLFKNMVITAKISTKD